MLKIFKKHKEATGIITTFVIAFIFITVVVVSLSWRDRQHAKVHASQHQIR